MSKEAMKLALKRAFQYGADHWYQADHDSYKENKKADKTLEEFRRFVDETCEALAEQPAQQEPPTVAELVCVCGAEWEWRNRDWELVATPPAQRTWVGLTDEEKTEIRRKTYALPLLLMEAIEAKLKEKNQ